MSNRPWVNEPDYLAFAAAGFQCEIRRNRELGHLCGYVWVPEGHPCFGSNPPSLEVHGGISFAEQRGAFWGLGFDCAQAGDLVPALEMTHRETYRDLAYVRQQTEQLANQLAARAPGPG